MRVISELLRPYTQDRNAGVLANYIVSCLGCCYKARSQVTDL